MAFSSFSPLRLALLDDHAVVRHGLSQRLAQESDFLLVGSYAASRELLSALPTLAVDVVVIDFSLGPSDIDGLNLIRALKVRFPDSKALVVSAHYNAATVALALRAGARGFVGKGQELDELIKAIRAIANGRVYVEPEMAAEIAMMPNEMPNETPDHAGADALTEHAKLSPREREVLRCCLDGMSVTQIAAKFARSINTISTQKQSAFRKLGIRTDNELFKIRHQLDKT